MRMRIVRAIELCIGFWVRAYWSIRGVRVGKGLRCRSLRSLRLAGRANVEIGEHARILSPIRIGRGAEVEIGPHFFIGNADLRIGEGSVLQMGAAVTVGGAVQESYIHIDRGTCRIGPYASIQSSVTVRFGGLLEIGAHTGSGSGTEFVVDEHVRLGSYCLLSYNICIYDTNSHPSDFIRRRASIERRGLELERPETKPVTIGDDVWVGRNSVIPKGVNIGSRSIVGMGTVVTPGDYPADSRIVMSRPRVIVRAQDTQASGL